MFLGRFGQNVEKVAFGLFEMLKCNSRPLSRPLCKWSDEDRCYIGYCPDLYFGGVCHGDSEEETYAELCSIVRDEIDHRLEKGETLPKPIVRATKDLDFAAA